MKRCSTLSIIREMQIKTAICSSCTPMRMANIQKTWLSKCLVRMRRERNSHSLQTGMENGQVMLENSLTVSHKGKHKLTMWFISHIPRYLLNWYEILGPYETWIWMFIAKLTNMKHWKQARCPSVGKCINKLWCSHTMEYYQ